MDPSHPLIGSVGAEQRLPAHKDLSLHLHPFSPLQGKVKQLHSQHYPSRITE